MTKDFNIVKESVTTTFINIYGNRHNHTDIKQFFLKDKDDQIISHQYCYMFYLGDDHFAVCKPVTNLECLDFDYYPHIQGKDKIETKLKWGIIRINRDESGKIIPGGETLIVPYLYDKISSNNSKTATAYHNKKLTYIDIDIQSENYSMQLVPCILEHATPFDIQYKGFAECSINGIVGYLPRNCKPKEILAATELLTPHQAYYLSQYFRQNKNIVCLGDNTVLAYFNLTGIVPIDKKDQLKRIRRRNPQKKKNQ